MLISTMTKAFSKEYGYAQAIKRLAEIGFDCLDLTLTHFRDDKPDILLEENYKDEAKNLRRIAEENGIRFNQCHAPYFGSSQMALYKTDSTMREKIILRTLQAIEIAGLVGAKAIVIHPSHFQNFNISNPQEVLQRNIEFYGNFISEAKRYDLKIAVENMWQKQIYTGSIIADVCSNPYDLAHYVDTLNEKYDGGFIACLDIGHCALTGIRPEDAIHILGDRLGALHVHDNDAQNDAHIIPESGVIEFAPVMQALNDIGYKGEFTFEADKFIESHPTSLYTDAAKSLLAKAKELINLIK